MKEDGCSHVPTGRNILLFAEVFSSGQGKEVGEGLKEGGWSGV